MRKCSLLTPLIAAGALMIPTAAWAQGAEGEAEAAPPAEAPAAEAAPVETAQAEEAAPEEAAPPPPPAEEPMPAEPMAEPAPAPAEAMPPAEAPAEEEEGGVPGWFRIDSDALTLQLWVGATHDVGGVGIATDVYVDSGYWGEFDLGVEIPIGESVLLIPMAGIAFDWGAQKPQALVAPQLFGYFDFDPIYIEWWSQVFLYSVFADPGYADDGSGMLVKNSDLAADEWYNRLFILYNATENFSIGPQLEAHVALKDAAKNTKDNGELGGALFSMPIGGRVNLGYGENNTLGLFLGYETVKEHRNRTLEVNEDGTTGDEISHGIVGRISFVRTW